MPPEEYKKLEEMLLEKVRQKSKELEKIGYDAIEYQTSDATIKENIESNDYEFYPDGRIYVGSSVVSSTVYTTNQVAFDAFVAGFKKTGPKHGNEGTEIKFERANDMEQDGSVNLHAESYFVFLDDPQKSIQWLQDEGLVFFSMDSSGSMADFEVESDDGFLTISIHPKKNLALIDGWVSAFTEDDPDDIEDSGKKLGRLMSMWGENLKKSAKA
jgi:hypothetical protein